MHMIHDLPVCVAAGRFFFRLEDIVVKYMCWDRLLSCREGTTFYKTPDEKGAKWEKLRMDHFIIEFLGQRNASTALMLERLKKLYAGTVFSTFGYKTPEKKTAEYDNEFYIELRNCFEYTITLRVGFENDRVELIEFIKQYNNEK